MKTKKLKRLAMFGLSISIGITLIIVILYFFSEEEWYEEHIMGEWLGLIIGLIIFISGVIGYLALRKLIFSSDTKKERT